MATSNLATEQPKVEISLASLTSLIGDDFSATVDPVDVDARLALNMLSTAAQEMRVLAHSTRIEEISEEDLTSTMWRLAQRCDAVANIVNAALRAKAKNGSAQ